MTAQPYTEAPSLNSFGARLALIRWAQRWNIKEAALACRVPQASWREWELSGRMPRGLVEVAAKISEATGYDHYWVLTGTEKAPDPDGSGEKHNTKPLTDWLTEAPSGGWSERVFLPELVAA